MKLGWVIVVVAIIGLSGGVVFELWRGNRKETRNPPDGRAGKKQEQKTEELQKTTTKRQVKPEDKFIVVTWLPQTKTLLLGKLGGEKIVNVRLEVPKAVVIIPVNRPGQAVDERLLMAEKGGWWERAFCPGDEVEIEGLGKDWEKFTDKQVIFINKIRNLGPRVCGE